MKRTLKVLGAVVAASALFVGCQNDTDNSDIVQAIMTSAATTQKVSVENKLSAPEVFATIDNSGVALLKWNPVLGAKDYKVYSSYDDMKNWKYEGSSNNTFYRFDEPVVLNTNYKYKVVAVGEGIESASVTEGEFKSPETLSAIKALEADSIEVTENAVIKNAFDVEIKVNPAASYMAYLTPNTGDADLNISKAYGYSMFNVDGLSYATVNSQGKISEGTWRFTISSMNSSADGEAVLTVVETPYNSKAFAANKVVSTKKVTLTPSNVSIYSYATVARTSPTGARVKFAVNKVNGKEVDATYDVYRTETKNGVTGGMSLIGQAKKSYSAEGSSYVEYAFDDENVAAVHNKDMISSYTYTVVAKTGSTTSAITTVQFNVNSASSGSATAVARNDGSLRVEGVTVDENGIRINKSEVNLTVTKTKNSNFKVYVASFSTLAEAENALKSEVTTEITSDFKAVESPLSISSSTTDGVMAEGYDYYKLNNYSLDAGVTVQNNMEYSSEGALKKDETKTTNTGKFYVFKMVTTREGYQDVVSIKKAYVTKHITVTKVGDAEPTKHEYYSVTIE